MVINLNFNRFKKIFSGVLALSMLLPTIANASVFGTQSGG